MSGMARPSPSGGYAGCNAQQNSFCCLVRAMLLKGMAAAGYGSSAALRIHFQRRDKCLLRDFNLAELPHLLFAGLLLLQKLALAGDVAAVTLGGHVLAQSAHGLARDDLAADCRLDRDLEHVRR